MNTENVKTINRTSRRFSIFRPSFPAKFAVLFTGDRVEKMIRPLYEN